MAETLKRLGASKPAATTNTALVVIDTNRSATVILHCCNQSSAVDTVRVAHIDGVIGALDVADYALYDFPIEPKFAYKLN